MDKEYFILKVFFTLIAPLGFIAVLLIVALYMLWKSVFTGSIYYGYKYYKPAYKFQRKENPFGFWLGVVLYLFGIAVFIFLAAFILNSNGVHIL